MEKNEVQRGFFAYAQIDSKIFTNKIEEQKWKIDGDGSSKAMFPDAKRHFTVVKCLF
ncbi:MAG TPA: hypothetical protein H9807_10865 [Candidatus Bacteroides merdavium]|uniref:Uncharacterized protein n=1 Tax=Candidatus Bacteroides merdavium TaxID=2838472 RepID=A0A9D2H0J6_9BACE|nr:hypothetical protein [Candidatus Bacteroides merdavium]